MSASTVPKRIRDLATLLVDDASTETLQDIKRKLLSLADELEKENTALLGNQDIDSLLDEIDKNERKNAEDEEEYEDLEYRQLASSVSSTFHTAINVPSLQTIIKNTDISETSFILIFIKPSYINNDTEYIPSLPTDNVTESDLVNLFQDVPNHLFIKNDQNQNIINCMREREFIKWFINYGINDKQNQTKKSNDNIKTWKMVSNRVMSHAYWLEMRKLIRKRDVERIAEYYTKHKLYIDINKQSIREGSTMLHDSVKYDNCKNVMEWLLSIPGIDDTIKNNEGNTVIQHAKKLGKWDVVTQLTFYKMSNKMREKSDEQIAKLNRNKGIIKQWFRFYKIDNVNSNEYKSMVKMVESIKTLIRERLPISDDMLLLCFYFEMKQNEDNPIKCSLWQCLYNTLNEVLRIPLNRRNWLWFKQYIFNSSLWFQKMDDQNDKLLYHLLMEMVAKQLKAQKDYLKPYIDRLEKKEETKDMEEDDDDDNSWERLKNYVQFIVTDNPEGLRQDQCTDKETGKELLPYPIRPTFSDDQLQKLSPRIKEFNCHKHYDVNGYLSQLILTAHSLNETFHNAMRLIFNVDKQTSCNVEHGLKYLKGSVKKLPRAQSKAETDYSHCSYPTTAKVVDFIRCCLVYQNAKELLNGIDIFVKTVNAGFKAEKNAPDCVCCGKEMKMSFLSEELSKYAQCICCGQQFDRNTRIFICNEKDNYKFICTKCGETELGTRYCLKKILRVKNMFLENKKENNNEWDLYKYADIKMGVLMEYNGQSMIVEVQFLLDWMLSAKSLGHGLYEIERNKDFIFDVNKIINLGFDGNDIIIDNMIRKAVISGDENQLSRFILNESPVDLINVDETKNSLLHYAIKNGHKKIVKLLLDTMQSDRTKEEFYKYINFKGEDGCSPIHSCQLFKKPELLKLLLSYNEIDINLKDDKFKETILFKCLSKGPGPANNQQSKSNESQILNMIVNDERCNWNITNTRKQNILMMASMGRCNVDIVKKIWSMGQFKINQICSFSGRSALIYASGNFNLSFFPAGEKGNIEVVEFLLNIQNIDINIVDKYGETALDHAIRNGYTEIIHILYNRKDLNWKAGRNKLMVAIKPIVGGIKNVELCKLVMTLWPDIDINYVEKAEDGTQTPLIVACIDRPEGVLEYVLSLNGINPNICDSDGYTAWLKAISYGEFGIEYAQILYNRKDIDFNKTINGKNAMDLAIEINDEMMMDWLKSNGFTKTSK